MNASEYNDDHFVEEQLSRIQQGRGAGRVGGLYHLGVLNTYISIFPKTDLLAAPI